MDGKSFNISQEKLNQLKQIFPEVFKEYKVDYLQLKALLGEEVFVKDEAYGLSWAGKYDAFKEIQKQTTATLIPDRENSIDFDTAENIFIEGENLEVLRVLQKSYYGKIKMIYIDPPYNTGNDFIYNDKFAEHKTEYLQKIGAIDEFGNIVNASLYQQNTRESGRFHSVWLSLMYPRLYLAKNLLREDGIIFISIDDNEVHNLRLLLDEIFEEENVELMIWRKSGIGRDGKMKNTTTFRNDHEYIFVCYKTNKNLNKSFEKPNWENEYGNPDNDIRGNYKAGSISRKEEASNPNHALYYTVISPSGKKFTRQFDVTFDEFEKLYKDNRIYWGKNGDAVPAIKVFANEKRIVTTSSLIDEKSCTTTNGSKELDEILNLENIGIEIRPKPASLLNKLVQIGSQKNDIILDFFAGSGTTAQAVLELNEEDNGNRKFICVQLNEKCKETSEAYKAGYKTIADITKARITRVIQKLKTERNGKMQLDTNPQSLSFKSFRLDDSNFKKWNNSISVKTELANQLQLHIDSTKEGSKTENMLQELILKLGLPLTTKIENRNSVFFVIDYKIAICLETFNLELRKNIIDWKPRQVVILDSLFESDDFLTNAKLRFKEHEIELTVI